MELGLEARGVDDGVKLVAGLPVLAAVPARDAVGVFFVALAVFPVPLSFALAFVAALAAEAEFTLFFAGVPAGFAIVLAEEAADFGVGLSVSLTVFTSLLATVFRIDFFCGLAAALLFAGEAVLTAGLLALLAAVLLVADLVTVAFMVCLHY